MSITRRGVLALAGGLAAGAGCTACSPGPGSASPSVGPSATATARPALSVSVDLTQKSTHCAPSAALASVLAATRTR